MLLNKGAMLVLEVCLFSIVWLAYAGFNLYHIFQESEDRDFVDQLMEIERFIAPSYIAKCMLMMAFALLAFDIVGFYLAYKFAYALVNDIYYRITFFFVCFCIFFTEQIIALRFTVRVSSVIKRAEDKPRLLQRWVDKNDPDLKTFEIIAIISKFTIALQLFMFTVLAHI